MERLSECPHGNFLLEPQTGQRLDFSDGAVAYRLRQNVDFWPGDRSPDGVVIGKYGENTWVCFVEIKTSSRSTSPAHAWSQLEMGVTHFAPSERCKGMRTHGDSHHDRWQRERTGSDHADHLEILPEKEHCIAAIKVLWRNGRRPHPKIREVCGKKVRFVTVGLSMKKANEVKLAFEEFCKKATLPIHGC